MTSAFSWQKIHSFDYLHLCWESNVSAFEYAIQVGHNVHHQMVNTEIRLIIFFAAKDGEALYSMQKQDWELTVAQIMNSLLPNSDLN